MKIVVEKDGELLDYLVNHLDMPKKRIKQYLSPFANVFTNAKQRWRHYSNQYSTPQTVL